jgi:hypothetical protein
LPVVELVDLNDRKKDDRALFGAALLDGLGAALERGEQALVFLNRRGHTRVVVCEDCGAVATCPSCDVALTWHSSDATFRCHYCDHEEKARGACAKCGSPFFKHKGSGTQRAEKELHGNFPAARVLRLDSDSAKPRGAQSEILTAFGKREADVLLGTQMIAKGLDFHGVTFVGVVSADGSLHLPDFRAGERTFQSIVQVAGRAGRGRQPGRVIVQTRAPGIPRSPPRRRTTTRRSRPANRRSAATWAIRRSAGWSRSRCRAKARRRSSPRRSSARTPCAPRARNGSPARKSAAPRPKARSRSWAPRLRRCRSCAGAIAGGSRSRTATPSACTPSRAPRSTRSKAGVQAAVGGHARRRRRPVRRPLVGSRRFQAHPLLERRESPQPELRRAPEREQRARRDDHDPRIDQRRDPARDHRAERKRALGEEAPDRHRARQHVGGVRLCHSVNEAVLSGATMSSVRNIPSDIDTSVVDRPAQSCRFPCRRGARS